MRIIAGNFRGIRLGRPVSGIRPTTDRARETLFNVLQGGLEGSSWIDAYAGSGAIGLEAISRGARYVVFNDRDPEAVRLIRDNLARCGAVSGFQVHGRDAFTLFRELRGQSFDFVFLDPPYEFSRYRKLLEKVAESVVEPGRTLVILEIFKKTPRDFCPPGWHVTRTLEVGDSHFVLLKTGLRESAASPLAVPG